MNEDERRAWLRAEAEDRLVSALEHIERAIVPRAARSRMSRSPGPATLRPLTPEQRARKEHAKARARQLVDYYPGLSFGLAWRTVAAGVDERCAELAARERDPTKAFVKAALELAPEDADIER